MQNIILNTNQLNYSTFKTPDNGISCRLLIIDEKDVNSDISKKLRWKSHNSTTFSFNNDEKKFGVQKYYLMEDTQDKKDKINKYYDSSSLDLYTLIRDKWENDNDCIDKDKCDFYFFTELPTFYN